jgi:uncharacterized RDD family membrane protein YckC
LSDLVIGEGVALDLRLAKLPSRALAKILDLVVQLFASSILATVVGLVIASSDTAVATGVFTLFAIAVIIGYPALMETVTRGRTVGKMALGLRVVRLDGGPIKFRQALVRALAGIIDFIVTVGVLAVTTSFCSKQGRRTGDFLAGTVVVRDRTPDAGVTGMGLAALAMPYPLLGWAQAQDLSMLPDDLALTARQYLTRMSELRPEIAARMGLELAEEMARYVPPPPNVPPWAFLAAVTAERRARQMLKAETERRAAWEQAQRMRVGVGAPYGQAYPGQAYPGQPQGSYAPAPAPQYLPPQPPPMRPPMQPPVQGQVPPTATYPQPVPEAPDEDGFKPPV